MQISGEIVVAAENASFEAATAFIYIEDTGRADAAAQRLGRATLRAAHRQGAESRIPFAVEATGLADTGTISIRVHVSQNGTEDVAVRDLVSTAHIPATEGDSVAVAVSPV